jgi:excinuclease UvrABC nuclease subunit
MPSYVYRHFDSAGVLLYVGCTNTPEKRKAGHRRQSPWFHKVASIETQTFSSRAEALAAETKAISTENPLFNGQSGCLPELLYTRRPELDVNPQWYTGLS